MAQAATTAYTAPGFCEHFLHTLYDMQQAEKFCDLRLDAKNGVLRTHSLIFLANSKFFQNWIIHQSHELELSYEIPDLNVEEAKGIIKFLYTGILELSGHNINSYLDFFEKHAIDEAINLCHEFILSRRLCEHTMENESGTASNDKTEEVCLSTEQPFQSASETIGNKQCSDFHLKNHSDISTVSDSAQSQTCVTGSECSRADDKLLLHVKLEKMDDDFSELKDLDEGSDKLQERKEEFPINDFSVVIDPVKRKRGRCVSRCKDRQSLFKLRCRGRKVTTKVRCKNNVKPKQKKIITQDSINDDSADETVKTELSNMKNKQKKRCRERKYPRKYSCEFCGHKSVRYVELESHRHSKHDIPFDASKYTVYKCELCDFETNIPKRLEKHHATHTEERPNICEHCGKTFKLINDLNAHVQSHIFPEKFSCHICGKSFSSPFTVKDHITNIHLGQKKQFLCHLCCHVTADSRNLTLHLWQKHQIPVPKKCKLFKCDDCDFETVRKHKFTIHRKLHTGVRDHVCKICGKGYLTGGALRSHMLWHSDKIHQCTFEACNYSSPSKRQLDQHVRLMHTQRNLKPYACHLCSHRCSVQGNLNKHLRTVHNLDIPDKRRLSHLYNLGRCGKSRIPVSSEKTNVDNPSTRVPESNKDDIPQTTGQTVIEPVSDFSSESAQYAWTSYQNYYPNVQY